MTAAADFRQAIRSGRRFGADTFVAHYWCCTDGGEPPRVGFAVGKSVGNSVVRHRVARKLRHVASPHLAELPEGSLLVLRAKPASAHAESSRLDSDLALALRAFRGRR